MTQNFCEKCNVSIINCANFCTNCGERIKKPTSYAQKSSIKKPMSYSQKSEIKPTQKDENMIEISYSYEGKKIIIKERKDVAEKIAMIMAEGGGIREDLGENILWSGQEKSGLFKRGKSYIVTNYRIMNIITDEKMIQMPLKYIDVVIMNTHRVSSRTGIGAFTSIGMGIVGGMQSYGKSVTIGDVNFLFQGNVLVTIPNIIDPNGLKSLVTLIKKKYDSTLENIKLP